MSDARRYAVCPEPRSRSLKGSRPSVPHGTNFYYYYLPELLRVMARPRKVSQRTIFAIFVARFRMPFRYLNQHCLRVRRPLINWQWSWETTEQPCLGGCGTGLNVQQAVGGVETGCLTNVMPESRTVHPWTFRSDFVKGEVHGVKMRRQLQNLVRQFLGFVTSAAWGKEFSLWKMSL